MKNLMLLNKITIILSILLVSGVVWFQTGKFINVFFMATPIGVVVAVILWLIDHQLWRWSVTKSFFGNIPNLNGVWKGEAKKNGDREAHYMSITVRQTWSKIVLEFHGDRAHGATRVCQLEKTDAGFKISYIWHGEFDHQYDADSQLINGAGTLASYSENVQELRGFYWTYVENAKSSTGTLRFTKELGENK